MPTYAGILLDSRHTATPPPHSGTSIVKNSKKNLRFTTNMFVLNFISGGASGTPIFPRRETHPGPSATQHRSCVYSAPSISVPSTSAPSTSAHPLSDSYSLMFGFLGIWLNLKSRSDCLGLICRLIIVKWHLRQFSNSFRLMFKNCVWVLKCFVLDYCCTQK